MRFEALELAIDVINDLRPLMPAVQRQDPKLAKQIREATNSVPLNLGEGNRRQGRDRLHLWRVASGSAEEVRTALRVAAAWGYFGEGRAEDALAKLDRVQAVLWKLTH